MSKSTPVTAFREDLLSQCLALSKKTTYAVSAHHQIALIKILQSKKIVQNIDISSYRVKKNLFELISTTHEIKTTVKLCNRCSKNIIRILIQLYFSKQSQSIVFQVSVYCGQHMFVKKFVSMILVSSAHLFLKFYLIFSPRLRSLGKSGSGGMSHQTQKRKIPITDMLGQVLDANLIVRLLEGVRFN